MNDMYNPPHPGVTLREDVLPALGLTVAEAAEHLGMAPEALADVLNGRAAISPEMALRIEGWLGVDNGGRADVWLSQQAAYDQVNLKVHAGEATNYVKPVVPLPRLHPFSGVGHFLRDTQASAADSAPLSRSADHVADDTHCPLVGAAPLSSEVGQHEIDAQLNDASLAPLPGRSATTPLSPKRNVPNDHPVSPDQGHAADVTQTELARIHPSRDADLKARILSNPDALTEYEAQSPEFDLARERISNPSREVCQNAGDAHAPSADLSPICDHLRELHRQRQDLHRAEKSLTLQIKAKCRRMSDGDKKAAAVLYLAMFGKGEHDLAPVALAVSAPFISARSLIEGERKLVEKQMQRAAAELPVAQWVLDTRGFGIMSLAAIIGETGDLGMYANPAKVWKRMGLAVIGGGRQRRIPGAEAIEHGYSPTRRSVMWNVGQTLFKSQSAKVDKETGEVLRTAGEYRSIYDARKAYETPRVKTKAHAHNRACRYMEKRVLRDLWRVWRDIPATTNHGADPQPSMPLHGETQQ